MLKGAFPKTTLKLLAAGDSSLYKVFGLRTSPHQRDNYLLRYFDYKKLLQKSKLVREFFYAANYFIFTN